MPYTRQISHVRSMFFRKQRYKLNYHYTDNGVYYYQGKEIARLTKKGLVLNPNNHKFQRGYGPYYHTHMALLLYDYRQMHCRGNDQTFSMHTAKEYWYFSYRFPHQYPLLIDKRTGRPVYKFDSQAFEKKFRQCSNTWVVNSLMDEAECMNYKISDNTQTLMAVKQLKILIKTFADHRYHSLDRMKLVVGFDHSNGLLKQHARAFSSTIHKRLMAPYLDGYDIDVIHDILQQCHGDEFNEIKALYAKRKFEYDLCNATQVQLDQLSKTAL